VRDLWNRDISSHYLNHPILPVSMSAIIL
jgi:hypothetical protein